MTSQQSMRQYRRFARLQGLHAVATIPRAVAATTQYRAEVLTDDAVGYARRAARWAHRAEWIGLTEEIGALDSLGKYLS